MAIEYAGVEIVSAGADSSATALSAYISRTVRTNNLIGARYNFSHKARDLVHRDVLLPEGAPEQLRNANVLWEEVTSSETTIDRVTGQVRYKKNAQLAKAIVLALPKELDDADRLEIVRRFIQKNFTCFGLAVEFAIHRPDDDAPNHHAHVLVTTRFVTKDGLGNKARILNPSFATNRKGQRFVSEQDYIGRRWAAEQNAFFVECGLDIRVDPTRSSPTRHVGRVWHASSSTEREKLAHAGQMPDRSLAEPATLLNEICVSKSKFSKRDLERLIGARGIRGADRDRVVSGALAHPDIIPLYDPAGRELFTTRPVRSQEQGAVNDGVGARRRGRAPERQLVAEVIQRHSLDTEQAAALQHLTAGKGIGILIGRAGAGKTRTLAAAREVYENSGYRVIGLAPTNTAALLLRSEAGFAEAMTAHRALFDLEKGRRWDSRTILVLDEAGQLDAIMYGTLLKAVAASGATLLLAGDDRQYGSVRRGGIFAELIKECGAAELKRVRRQQEDWQKDASEAFASGRTSEGLRAYSSRGYVHWSPSLDTTRQHLVADWFARKDQARPQFIYASTNDEVNRLNLLVRSIRRKGGEVGPGILIESDRGTTEISAGDRIQFYGNDRRLGIYNGALATVVAVSKQRVQVRTDSGASVVFNPGIFTKWGFGYAGTIYRGQGKTQVSVYALFDNPYAWSARAAYVGMTRHKSEVHLYVSNDVASDEASLIRLMSRIDDDSASIAHEVLTPERRELEKQKAAANELRVRMGLIGPQSHRPLNNVGRAVGVRHGRLLKPEAIKTRAPR